MTTHESADLPISTGALRQYTVFGLRDNDTCGATLIAAVVPGEVFAVDSTDGDEDGYQRVATGVEAADPDEAERLAYEQFEADRDN